MESHSDVPDVIKSHLRSKNPVSRGTAIYELVSGGYSAPDLVEPLASDEEPFMFGIPILAPANAYLSLTAGTKYEGPYGDTVSRFVIDMSEEWGKGSFDPGEN